MTSLIDNLTKNLKPCSGCGNSVFQTYDLIKEKLMPTFVLQIVVDADNLEQAIAKKTEGEVISVNPRPQSQVVQAGVPNPAITALKIKEQK